MQQTILKKIVFAFVFIYLMLYLLISLETSRILNISDGYLFSFKRNNLFYKNTMGWGFYTLSNGLMKVQIYELKDSGFEDITDSIVIKSNYSLFSGIERARNIAGGVIVLKNQPNKYKWFCDFLTVNKNRRTYITATPYNKEFNGIGLLQEIEGNEMYHTIRGNVIIYSFVCK